MASSPSTAKGGLFAYSLAPGAGRMLHRARCPAAAARRVALPGRQARHASSSAEGAPGLPLRAWARAGASLQLCAGVVLGGTVLYQAGQQAALERKLHQLESSLKTNQPDLHSTYEEAASKPTVHEHSALQRWAQAMLGKDRKFGDLLFVAAMFPLACAVVGAASTRTSRHLAAKQAQAAQVVVKRAVAKTCASPLPSRRVGMPN